MRTWLFSSATTYPCPSQERKNACACHCLCTMYGPPDNVFGQDERARSAHAPKASASSLKGTRDKGSEDDDCFE